MIISLYAKGMTVRDIQHHLLVMLSSELSARDDLQQHRSVAVEVMTWQAWPSEAGNVSL